MDVWTDADGDDRCGLDDVATSASVDLDDRPHRVPSRVDHPPATGVLWAVLSAERFFNSRVLHRLLVAARCPDRR